MRAIVANVNTRIDKYNYETSEIKDEEREDISFQTESGPH